MKRHPQKLVTLIRTLRTKGKTYGEINKTLNTNLAKSTLHWICKDTSLPQTYLGKITKLNIKNLGIARATAQAVNQSKKEELLNQIRIINSPVSKQIMEKKTAKIALAMLCLGEASKSKTKHAFSLGSTDHKIVWLFLSLLKNCFNTFDLSKIRATVQCRADQDTEQLKNYWHKLTNIPLKQFYKPLIDPRTAGKPTKMKDYKGVLNIYYSDRKVQLELESLAELIYNQLQGPVVQRQDTKMAFLR